MATIEDNLLFFNELTPIDDAEFEVVERKGWGHPDTLADGIAETLSNEYAKYCLQKFGAVLHHNVDKVSIIGGLVDIDFGKGKIIKPAKFILNGRMSSSFGKARINIPRLQKEVVKRYIAKVLPDMDLQKGVEICTFTSDYSHNPNWYHPRSLQDLPELDAPHANDTSACVGYWPLSLVEQLLLKLEGYFYHKDLSRKFDFIGQDMKFMAVREGRHIIITTCIPFILVKTPSYFFYTRKLNFVVKDLRELAQSFLPKRYKVEIFANKADKLEKYILLTGSCIEGGEEGVVGRGNKSRGTISSVRPYSMEASNGKNPVYHVGKVFTVIADSLSRVLAERFACECNVLIITRIKDPLYLPRTIIIHTSKKIRNRRMVEEIVNRHLNYRNWTRDIIEKGLLIPQPGQGNTYHI